MVERLPVKENDVGSNPTCRAVHITGGVKMKWHFPLMKYTHIRNKTNKIEDQIASVKRELAEVEEATTTVHKAEEIIDLLHSAETLARKFFQQNPDLSFKQMRADVIRKNKKRGYYV